MTRGSICFVSLASFPALAAGQESGTFGGAEVQQVHLARALRRCGYDVSFVTYDNGQEDGLDIDGIRVYKAFGRQTGPRGLRFVHPRWTGLCSAMRRAGADIYYQRTAGVESGQVCAWCGMYGRRFVFSAASDLDVDPALPALESWLEKQFYRYALRNAHAVVVQTKRQCDALANSFGRHSVHIPNCPPVADLAPVSLSRPTGRARVLWAGRFVPVKRPQWCLDVARQCPRFDFDVVGAAPADAAFEQGLRQQALSLGNVRMHGSVPHTMMGEFYRACSAVLCTSHTEGFPNTFLEAWYHGRPVVSSLDPDGVMATFGLGLVGGSPQELARSLNSLMDDDTSWTKAAISACAYVRQHHSIDRIVAAYERLFDSLMPTVRACHRSVQPADDGLDCTRD